MLVNLSDVLKPSDKKISEEISVDMHSFEGSMGDFEVKEAGNLFLEAVNLEEGKAKVSGHLSISFLAACDRCLKETEVPLEIEFERECSSPDHEILDEEDESRDFMDGYQLDISALLYNEITVNWPVKILCREDCKGLCPVCGHDLNEGDCGCDTFVPDPRMAALNDIFETTKEV